MTISTAPTEPALDAFWAWKAAEARLLRHDGAHASSERQAAREELHALQAGLSGRPTILAGLVTPLRALRALLPEGMRQAPAHSGASGRSF